MKYPANFLMCAQGSPEWLAARLGCVTASQVKRALGKGEARETYKIELLTERLTGRAVEHYVSAAMAFGTENEPLAKGAYVIETGRDTEEVGFVLHPTIKRAGCSPDALMGTEGLAEFKVPNAGTHIRYLLDDVVPDEYVPQIMWQLACTQREWCDFVSFQPPERGFNEGLSLFVKRAYRDESYIADMEKKVVQFLSEIDQLVTKLTSRVTLEDQLRASLEQQARSMGPEAASLPEL